MRSLKFFVTNFSSEIEFLLLPFLIQLNEKNLKIGKCFFLESIWYYFWKDSIKVTRRRKLGDTQISKQSGSTLMFTVIKMSML